MLRSLRDTGCLFWRLACDPGDGLSPGWRKLEGFQRWLLAVALLNFASEYSAHRTRAEYVGLLGFSSGDRRLECKLQNLRRAGVST